MHSVNCKLYCIQRLKQKGAISQYDSATDASAIVEYAQLIASVLTHLTLEKGAQQSLTLVQDVHSGVRGAVEIPKEPEEAVVAACVTSVEAQMAADRKTTALKHLQGLIWHEGFVSGEIKGELFRDVPDSLQQLCNLGVKVYIYSSGSRQAQRDLFGHTQVRSLGSQSVPCTHPRNPTRLVDSLT
jgi:hypothetical protein